MSKSLKLFDVLLGLLIIPASISILNYFLIWPIFGGVHTQHVSSIEISYIQMAEFLSDLWGNLSWQPFWYFGYPVHLFYTPLLPFLELILGKLAGIEFSTAYRILTGLSYILGPATVYFFVWGLTKRKIGGVVAAFAYSFLPSVIALIFPEVKADFLATVFEPRRYTIFVRWGEGPHIFSLVFVPLAGLFYLRSLETKRFAEILLASIFLTLTALSNPIGLWAAGLLAFSIFLASLTKVPANLVISVTVKVLLATLGLSAFWYNFSFIGSFFREGGGAVNTWLSLVPWGFLVILGIGAIVFLVTKKFFAKVEGLGAAFWFFLATFLIVFTYYQSGEARIELVPQALRLNTEVDLAVSILLGVAASWFFGLFWDAQKFPWLKLVAPVLPGILILAILTRFPILAAKLPAPTKSLESKGIKLENLAEAKVAKKLEELAGNSQTRVVAPGNYGFWLNYITGTPQLRGALFQSSIHHWPDHIYYQLTNGTSAAISLAWLKIANISHLVYTTGASAEPFKDYKVKPDKFDLILTKVAEVGGDVFYQVPLNNPVPAKLVDFEKLKKLKKPVNAIDEEPIFEYLSWIEESPKKFNFEKISDNKYKISGQIEEGEGILVQTSYHSGWQARVENNNQRLEVKKDPLGFMAIKPKKAGEQTILLKHGVVWQVWLGWLITVSTMGFLIWLTIKRKTENTEGQT